jgi:molybdopterin molybdotransferase
VAQLSDNCFAFGGRLMTTAEALALLEARTDVIAKSAATTLVNAAGRILAEDVVAFSNVPPHNNSAVDGYAVIFNDLKTGRDTRLPVTGRITAGHPLGRNARLGEAIRIFTGAVMPDCADTVLMQEDCREEDGEVIIRPGIKCGANMRQAGEDITGGDTVLQRGRRLRAQDIGLAASVGRTRLDLFAPLRVAVFSTGDELRKPSARLPTGCIYDSNRYTLIAALKQMGCRVTDLGIIADRAIAVREALAAAASSHDLLITSGGVSVGDEDHVCSAVEALGKLHFWRLAIRPGRPVALGQIGSTPFVGLPGNPVAVMVTFLLIARPLILRLGGATDIAPMLYKVRAGFDHEKKKDRREFVRARLDITSDGMPIAIKFPRDGAGILSSLVQSDGLVELPEDMTRLVAGNLVDFMPFSEINR